MPFSERKKMIKTYGDEYYLSFIENHFIYQAKHIIKQD